MTKYTYPQQIVAPIVSAFKNLWDYRIQFEQKQFPTNDEAATEISLNWDPAFLPNFVFDKGQLHSLQERYFWVLALGEAIAEFLRGVETFGAYYVLERKDFDQFANFVAYTSSFHLVDSVLSLGGIFYIPFPVKGVTWRTFRRVALEQLKDAPMMRLESEKLRKPNDEVPSHVLASWKQSKNKWEFAAINQRRIHPSRWLDYGEVLLNWMKTKGVNSIPKEVRQFLGEFVGYLAYFETTEDHTNKTPEGLKELIRFSCIGYPLYERELPAAVPELRSLAIYKDRSIDDYTRLIGDDLDWGIMGPPPKIPGNYLRRNAQGLIRYQALALSKVIENVKISYSSNMDLFYNGLLSSICMSNLVELNYDMIVDSEVFNVLQADLRDTVRKLFYNRRWIPIPQDLASWNTGTKPDPIFHTLRDPVTIGTCVKPNSNWPRPLARPWFSGIISSGQLPRPFIKRYV